MIYVGFERDFSRGGWSVYASRYTNTGRVPLKITIQEQPEIQMGTLVEPSLHFDNANGAEIINALLDGLQQAGLMPPQNATEAELTATIRHLNDMRSLVFETVPPIARIEK